MAKEKVYYNREVSTRQMLTEKKQLNIIQDKI